jgi:hypothetical protein
MAILWVGGEDIDFPNGAAPVVSTTSTTFRSGWARCSVGPNSSSNLMKSTVFPGGAITSDTGSLRDSIIGAIKTKKDKNGEVSGTLWVGPAADAPRTDGKKSVGPGVFSQWVEFGLKRKKYPSQPFARPTLDATGDKAVSIFSETLKAVLEEIAKE